MLTRAATQALPGFTMLGSSSKELVLHLEQRDAAKASRRRTLSNRLSNAEGDRLHSIFFHPYELPRRIWVALMLIVTFWELILTPYIVCFSLSNGTSTPSSSSSSGSADPFASSDSLRWFVLLAPSVFAAIDIPYSLLSGRDTGLAIDWDSRGHCLDYVRDGLLLRDVLALFPWFALPGAPRAERRQAPQARQAL
jgi:hypothetical protein